MKKWFNMTGLFPAVAVGMVAVLGFQTTVPTLTKVVWPEEPKITVEAKEKTDHKAHTKDEEKNETEKGVGNYEDGTFTGVGVGYGGKTTVSVTVASKQITSVDVLSTNDTPAYFRRAKNTVIEEILTAQTWEVDSVSGATYSSRGIKEAVCNAITGEESQSAEPEKAASPKLTATQSFTMGALKDGVYTGSARGFGGTIKVSVTIVGGKIKAIKVISHSGETSSYYNKATAIIDRILKKQTPNVDTVSGATYSSTGIREAVKKALKKAAGKSTAADEKEDTTNSTDTTEQKQPEVTVPAGTPKDGTYTGTASCVQNGRFDYQVTVSATYKDGKLVDISYTTTDNGDNESYISRAWIGMKQELLADQSGNVDVVSRATYTSNALKTAYKLAYKQAVEANGGKVDDPESDSSDTTADSKTDTSADSKTDTSADSTQKADDTTATTETKSETGGSSSDSGSADIKGTPADGSYKVSTKVNSDDTKKASYAGWFTDYTLTGTVTFKNGKLTAISGLTIGDEPDDYEYEDDQSYLNMASKKVVASLISKQSSDVDVVSGATCSSKAIIRLYEAGLKKAIEKYNASAATTASTATTETTTATTASTATTETTTATTASTATKETTTATTASTETTASAKASTEATTATSEKAKSTEAASSSEKSEDKKSEDKSDDKKKEDAKAQDDDGSAASTEKQDKEAE